VAGAVVGVAGTAVGVAGTVVGVAGTVVGAIVGCRAQPCMTISSVNPVKINLLEIFILLSP
jgi:uncharacterized membrane protein